MDNCYARRTMIKLSLGAVAGIAAPCISRADDLDIPRRGMQSPWLMRNRTLRVGLLWSLTGHLSMIDNVIGYEGKKFLIVTMDYSSEGNTSGFAYDSTGPWRP